MPEPLDLRPVETPSTPLSQIIKAVDTYANIITLGGFMGLVFGFLIWLLSELPTLGVALMMFSLGALCVVMIGHFSVSHSEPVLSLGNLTSDLRGDHQKNPPQSTGRTPRTLPDSRQSRVSLEELEQEYEMKKLEPHFVDLESEYVSAHNDEKGVIVRGPSLIGDTFNVLAKPLGNEHSRRKVRSVRGVGFRLSFVNVETDKDRIDIRRGAWLSEADTLLDFPIQCPPRRAIIATAEGQKNRVYAVRRDSDSEYKGVLPIREELTGSIYNVSLTLIAESHNATTLRYILEIVREPKFELRLTGAVYWKSDHLHEFAMAGFDFSTKLHEIWKYAQDQMPAPPTTSANILLIKPKSPERPTLAESQARIRAVEQEQEGKLIEGIKEWEKRAAEFLDLFIGREQRDKFIESVPSIDDGFNRTRRRSSSFVLLARSAAGKDKPMSLPYWTLRDAVTSRTDKLMKIIEQLR